MTDKINGRTPEEIKRGMECCSIDDCNMCPYEENCFSDDEELCESMVVDAIALTQQLEAERDQYKRERDAYLSSIKGVCTMCKRRDYCLLNPLPSCDRWQWRGI